MNIESFKNGIFNLRTRRFGKLGEFITSRLIDCQDSFDNSYDLQEIDLKNRIESKFSRAIKKHPNSNTLIDHIRNSSSEIVSYENYQDSKWDCNIQQIKKHYFDVLYFGIFFQEKVLIFKINSKDINYNIGYSNKQHRGNEGEGQFHIKFDNLMMFVNQFLIKELEYETIKQWVEESNV